MREAEIELVPYDASWPGLFAIEKEALAAVLEPFLVGPIEHVGSTAVPGLLAKPVIDVMAGVATLEMSRAAISAVVPLGYHHYPYRTDLMHWFCKPSAEHRTHHLHLVPFGSRLWLDRLRFRDLLRSRPEAAREYAALKQELAARHRDDREAYTDANGPFIERMLEWTKTKPRPAEGTLRLRDVEDADLDSHYEQQRDPEAVAMAQFASRTREAFDAHWAKIRRDPGLIIRSIDLDGSLVGSVACFPREGERLVGYWIDRRWWGKGIATRALAALLSEVDERPLFAHVAKTNLASIRVLQKCGFEIVREASERDPALDMEVNDVVLELS